MTRIITDSQLERMLDMRVAIDAVKGALRERANGTAVSLPREAMDIGSGTLVFTPGGFKELSAAGLRVYPAGLDHNQQLVATWDMTSGALSSIFVGSLLGAVRTGAIGGAAIDLLARPDADCLGVVGAGTQAYMQALAALSVRTIQEIRLYRRSASLLQEQAREWEEKLEVTVIPVESARAAVVNADVVVLATRADRPVVAADWFAPGVHINSLGPKYHSRSEIGLDLIERADLVVSDFPEQYMREGDFILTGSPALESLHDLAELAQSGFRRTAEEVTVFLSHGLAGTEVAVARAFEEGARTRGLGIVVG
jgi:ornithine cyclodeaminase/alanine dehydrogenase-like protein (mu-crystallin family)